MPDAPDILDRYPEYRFPADRASLTPKEIAKKMGASVDQVLGYVDDGSLARFAITAKGTKQRRSHVRIPVSSFYALMRRRLAAGWTPKDEPDAKQGEFKL